MMQRIGIMGGMFDPVHAGHLQAARAAMQVLELSHIYMVPCAIPNHREQPGASQQHRQAMLELAIGADSGFSVDDREFRRQGVSYAVDTLQSFAGEYPDAALVYVLGWDSFNSLPSWYRWRELFSFSHFCAVSRPGETLPTALNTATPAAQALLAELQARQVHSAQQLFRRRSGGIYILEDLAIPVSSSDVRQALEAGTTVNQLPAKVLDYIYEHKLYQSSRQP